MSTSLRKWQNKILAIKDYPVIGESLVHICEGSDFDVLLKKIEKCVKVPKQVGAKQ